MTNRCFCYIRGEYEFTVLLLLSGAININIWNIITGNCRVRVTPSAATEAKVNVVDLRLDIFRFVAKKQAVCFA